MARGKRVLEHHCAPALRETEYVGIFIPVAIPSESPWQTSRWPDLTAPFAPGVDPGTPG